MGSGCGAQVTQAQSMEQRVLASLGYTSSVEGLELQLQALAAHKQQEAMQAYFGEVERRMLVIDLKLNELREDIRERFAAVQDTMKVIIIVGTCACLKLHGIES